MKFFIPCSNPWNDCEKVFRSGLKHLKCNDPEFRKTFDRVSEVHFKDIKDVGYVDRPGIVHRLDKETSGVLLVAKTPEAFAHLKKQFQDRKVEKKYIALVYGNIIQNEGEIAVPIGRLGVKQVAINSVNKGLLGNVNKSRNARTGFKILARYSGFTPLEVAVPRSSGLAPKARARLLTGFTLVEAAPYTGRMHQIRVHFKYLGYPIVGDKKYAGKRISKVIDLPRHFLHSSYLSFNLPSGERVEFKSELPDELQAVIDQLERF